MKNDIFSHPLKNWPYPLKKTTGSKTLMNNVTIYYDFDPLSKHLPKRKFPNGKRITQELKLEAKGKTPCLLLTERTDNEYEVVFETDTEHVYVMKTSELRGSELSLLSAYAARTRNFSAKKISDFSQHDEQILELFADENSEELISLLRNKPGVLGALVNAVLAIGEVDDPLQNDFLVAELYKIEQIDAEKLHRFLRIFAGLGSDSRKVLLESIVSTRNGLIDTSQVVANQTSRKIEMVRESANEFSALIDKARSNETLCQEFLKVHPWIIGLEYMKVRPKPQAPRGQLDFLLERPDGFHDLLELKSPRHQIIIEYVDDSSDKSAPPNQYKLSPELANALAQAHLYRADLTENESFMENHFKIRNSRFPRVFVIIGHTDSLTTNGKRILEELNRSLHGVEIVAYDALVNRAKLLVDNIEKYLLDTESNPNES